MSSARRAIVTGLFAALSASGLAMAASLTDHDEDGRISRTEYRTAVIAIANAADANKDGFITLDEFAYTPADLALFDNNGDGIVTSVGLQEFIDGMDVAFDTMDTDMDNHLSAGELTAARGRYGIAPPVSMNGAANGDQAASAKPRPLSKG